MLPVGRFLDRFWSERLRERTRIRSQIGWAGDPGSLGPGFGPFALAFLPTPAQNLLRKSRPGTWTETTIEQPKVGPGVNKISKKPGIVSGTAYFGLISGLGASGDYAQPCVE